jgi:hypothetical protein
LLSYSTKKIMNSTIDNSRVARCQHVKSDGIQCNTPAIKHARYCYYHTQAERTRRAPYVPLIFPPLDNHAAILLSITDVLNRLARGVLDHHDARLMLRGLHHAMAVVRNRDQAATPAPGTAQIVTDTAALAPYVDPHVDRTGAIEHDQEESGIAPVMAVVEQIYERKARAKFIAEIEAEERARARQRYSTMPFPGPSPYTMTIEEIEAEERAEAEAATKAATEAAKRAAEEAATPRCRLTDHDICELVDPNGDSESGKCPIQYPACDDEDGDVITPDLSRFFASPLPCRHLHSLAIRAAG